jgi:hypothetical protein
MDMNKQKKCIYLKVTNDEYEHPVFMGNIKELAEHEHITISAIYSAISNFEHGRLKTTRFRRVRLDEDVE